MPRAPITALALLTGLLLTGLPLTAPPTAAAQEPGLWRDPDQGCTYLVTPQGGIGLRYRRDGSPDCPDGLAAARSLPATPGSAAAGRVVPIAPVTWPDPPGARAPAPWPGGPPSEAPRARPPVTWPGEPPAEAARARAAALALGAAQSFNCWTAGDSPRGNAALARVRVRVEAQSKVILVDASGGRDVARYTLDSSGDIWFNGRNERDPRLGIILSPSRGHMWLDVSDGAAPRGQVSSLPFECRPEGNVY